MATALAESTTNSHTVTPGSTYVFSIAGTWDGMTVTLKWSDGTTDIAIGDAYTADGAITFDAPTNTVKVVSGADATNAGSVIYSIAEKLVEKENVATGIVLA